MLTLTPHRNKSSTSQACTNLYKSASASAETSPGTLTHEHEAQLKAYHDNNGEGTCQHQLERWTYEVDNNNLTLAERLEKLKWES